MKKLLAILLSVFTMFSALSLSACADNEDKGEDSGAVTNIVFNGFENFDKDFLTMRVVDWAFGSAHQNFDKKYVKFGDSSVLFRPAGEIGYYGRPIIYLPTYSTRFEYNYKDMTKVETISAWFYNAQDRIYRVGMGLQTGTVSCNQTMDNAARTNTQKFDLVPGWNYVEYDMDHKYLECQGGLDLTNVFGICIQFEYHNQMLGEESPYIYVDDIRFHLSETDDFSSESFGLKADATNGVWEVADFEDARQAQFITVSNNTNPENRRLNAEVINANEASTTAVSGQNVLKITRHASYTSSHTYGFSISGKVWQEVFATIGNDLVENPSNYVIKFDWYVMAPNATSLSYSFMSIACTRGGPSWAHSNPAASAYEWKTHTVNIGKMDTEIYGQLTSSEPKSTYPRLLDGYTLDDAKFSVNPGSFSITLPKYPTGDRRDIAVLFDNFRVERVA